MKRIVNLYTDENLVRLTAMLVIATAVVALLFKASFIWLFLCFDFGLRAFGLAFAPFVLLSKLILKTLNVTPKPIFASPKRFAAALGAVFSAIIFLTQQLGYDNVAVVLGFLLILLAGLECFFKICVGCYIYQFLIQPVQRKNK